ncbi:MAG: hypothetical protein QM738_11870 [Ferruginibacter sp.]
MKYTLMRLLFFTCLIIFSLQLHAQKTSTDSLPVISSKELALTPEQKIAIKQMIWEYKMEERKRRRELRRRIFMILNVRQRMLVQGWGRRRFFK